MADVEIQQLRGAVAQLREQLAAMAPGHPDRAVCLNDLGFYSQVLAFKTEDFALLRSAIAVGRQAVEAAVNDPAVYGVALGNYRNVLMAVFGLSEEIELLRAAVQAGRDMAAATAGDSAKHPVALYLLCQDLAELIVRTHDSLLPGELAEVALSAAAHTPGDSQERSASVLQLLQVLWQVIESAPESALVAALIRIGYQTRAALPSEDPLRAAFLHIVWSAILGAPNDFELPGITDDRELLQDMAVHAREMGANGELEPLERAAGLMGLSRVRRMMAVQSNDATMLLAAVQAARDGLAIVDADSPIHPELSAEFVLALGELMEHGDDEVPIGELMTVVREAVTLAGPDHDDINELLPTLEALSGLLEGKPDASALRHAVDSNRTLLESVSPTDPRQIDTLGTLCLLLTQLFDATGETELPLLEEAACHARAVYERIPAEHPDRAGLLLNIAVALQKYFEHSMDLTALDDAVRVFGDLSALVEAGTSLSDDILARYAGLRQQVLRLRPDLESMRELQRVTTQIAPERVTPFGHVYEAIAQLTVDPQLDVAAVRSAIDRAREALTTQTLPNSDLAATLSGLALALMVASQRTGDRNLLVEALSTASRSAELIDRDDANWLPVLFNRAFVLKACYEASDDLNALEQAIRLGHEGVANLPAEHSGRPEYLSFMGLALMHWAARTSDRVALEEAIEFGRSAVAAAEGDLLRGVMLSNFGHALQDAYDRTQELTLIQEAVQVSRQALALSSPEVVDYPGLLVNLGANLSRLHRRTGEIGFLHEAIGCERAAVAAVGTEDLHRAKLVSNLATSLDTLYQLTADSEVLREAVTFEREAAALSAEGGPLEYSRCLAILSSGLFGLYGEDRTPERRAEYLRVARQAVALTPPDHPRLAVRQSTLGSGLMVCHTDTQDPAYRQEALPMLRAAVASVGTPASIRISAARMLAFAEELGGDNDSALATLEVIIELLPTVATRGLTRPDREHWLGQLSGLASEVAAIAIAANRPERAVELLEQCRGFLLAEALDDRDDLSELTRRAPQLAQELTQLRGRLTALQGGQMIDIAGAPGDADSDAVIRSGAARRDLAQQWSALLQRIRSLPGFEEFLRPPDIQRLRSHTVDGPIVVVFGRELPGSGGALIIPADPTQPVYAIELPALRGGAVTQRVERLDALQMLREGSLADRVAAEEGLHELLQWLWDGVAGPVLAELGIDGHCEQPARMWWLPVGALAHLPLQAAGYHRESGTRTVLDRTVSSVIATLRSLGQRGRMSSPRGDSALIIAMPHTEEAPPLAGVVAEAADIAALLRDSRTLLGHEATCGSVTDALPRYPIVHFACHGVAEPRDPSRSRLLLHDHRTEPLTVAAIGQLHLDEAELAYLSACSTTRTSARLIDEAIHLTAAIQLAGYRHVIGTLWAVNDVVAAEVASSFYRYLTDSGTRAASAQLSAAALNHAIRECRERYRRSPSLWAGHLHYGA